MSRRRLVLSCSSRARSASGLPGSSTRRWRAASAESCRSTAPARWRSPASTSMSAARTRSPRATPAGGSRSARASRRCGPRRTSARSREAPNLPDSTLDELVSSIIVEREQIGPKRYIADLGILFDRARAAELLGVGGDVQRSVPMLLIPVLITAGPPTTVELRNRLAARLGAVPDLAEPDRLCPGQRHGGRPAAGQCGADRSPRPRLVAQHHRPLRRRRHPGRARSSSSACIPAGRRVRASSAATAPTSRSSAASP